jgi:hypothetical protein
VGTVLHAGSAHFDGAKDAYSVTGNHYGNSYGPNTISWPMFEDLRDNNQALSEMFCRFPTSVTIGYSAWFVARDHSLISLRPLAKMSTAPLINSRRFSFVSSEFFWLMQLVCGFADATCSINAS